MQVTKICIFACVLWLGSQIFCNAAEDAGVDGPLALGVGARAMSFGRAYTGLAEDANAIYWNPGALGVLERKEVTSLYIPLYEATDYGFLAFAYPLSGFGTLGVGVMGLSTRGIPKTDEWDNDLGDIQDTQGQLLISYSRMWWNHLSGGLSLKLYYHSLDNHSGIGFGADLGAYYDARDLLPGLTLGFAASNVLEPQVTLISSPDKYPVSVRLGAAYRYALDSAANHRIVVAGEAEKTDFVGLRQHAGVEYQAFQLASLRLGWDADRLTAGLGVSRWDWSLDYALFFPNQFKPTQLIELSWRFGPTLAAETEQKRLELVNQLSRAQSQLHNQRGLEFMGQGEYKKAMDEFEKAASWAEDSPEITDRLEKARKALNQQQAQKAWVDGQEAFAQRKYFDALLFWQAAAKLQPALPNIDKSLNLAKNEIKHVLGTTALGGGRRTAAGGTQTQVWFQQGITYYLDGKWAQAVSVWERVAAKEPNFPKVQEFLARAREQTLGAKPKEGSGPMVDEKKRSQIEDGYKQGLVNYRQHRYYEARTAWEKVLSLDPNHAEARRGLERIQAILQTLEKQ